MMVKTTMRLFKKQFNYKKLKKKVKIIKYFNFSLSYFLKYQLTTNAPKNKRNISWESNIVLW